MNQSKHSQRAKIDVINIWCVIVLVVSAVSAAGVMGAAVYVGEFDDRDFDADLDNASNVGVLIESNPDGTTRVRWSDRAEIADLDGEDDEDDEDDVQFLQIMVDGEQVDTIGAVGEETIIDSETFEVEAVYDDRIETVETVE